MNQDVLAAVSPAIILVEEAAEVMEPQLMALLSKNTQHLILVGDHKQLQPYVACHELKIRHNLAVSMLERLAEYNKLPYRQLCYQARMLEEFVPMVKNIYPNLQSNVASVNGEKNEPAKGMASSMYFWNHSMDEITGRSPANKHEAYMVVALFRHLIAAGNKHNEITILCAYRAQVLEITAMLSETMTNEEATVLVQTIDQFQGSENQIIIASLVRSNAEGSIGHLSEQNRYCVTVSRARSAFYACGNAKTLSQVSSHWKYLVGYLKSQDLFGEEIYLVCPRHPIDSIPLHSDNAKDFSPLICTKPCEAQLACGHHCTKPCHIGEHALCTVRVPFVCPDCQRSTIKSCSSWKCMKLVSITLDRCGHTKMCMCWQKTHNAMSALVCRLPCEKTLSCGHLCSLICSKECGSEPCPKCVAIKGIKEPKLLVNQKEKKLADVESLIKTQKNEAEVGASSRRGVSSESEISKEQEAKKLNESQIEENTPWINSQIKLKSELEVRLCSSKYMQGQAHVTAEPTCRNLVKDIKAQKIVPAVNARAKIRHFSTGLTVRKSHQNEFSRTNNLLCCGVRYLATTFQQTHQKVHSSFTQQGLNVPLLCKVSPCQWQSSATKSVGSPWQNKRMSMEMTSTWSCNRVIEERKQTIPRRYQKKDGVCAMRRFMWWWHGVARVRTIMARVFF